MSTGTGGVVTSASVQTILDTTPPRISIITPDLGTITIASAINVTGLVNDVVVGTVNDQNVTVTVNGSPTAVSNRSFSLPNVPLNLGANFIQVECERSDCRAGGESACEQDTLRRFY